MDLRKIEEIVKEPKGGVIEKKDAIISNLNNSNPNTIPIDDKIAITNDSATALQIFLDHIPITSIPGITDSSSSVLELTTQDSVKDAIGLMYEKNASGALIADISTTYPSQTLSQPYFGFIHFDSMLVWSLEELENHWLETNDHDILDTKLDASGFLFMLEHIPRIAQTKIGELAKAFLWDPFFPVNVDETLFHVLLLLTKHQLHIVPVSERSTSNIIGFITENAVNQMLLQFSGLEWFDNIADRALTDFRLEEPVVSIYGDQSIADAVHALWEKKAGVVAVVQRATERLIGCVRRSDLYLLLEKDDIFTSRKSTTVEQFIHMETIMEDPNNDRELGALLSAGRLVLKNKFLPRMDSQVVNRKTDTLKQAMRNLAESQSSFSFLLDEAQKVVGILTLRDVIVEFAPPCMDSRIDGGGFFESALNQTGCIIRDGTMIYDP